MLEGVKIRSLQENPHKIFKGQENIPDVEIQAQFTILLQRMLRLDHEFSNRAFQFIKRS